jgi:spore maturation protein CgeB
MKVVVFCHSLISDWNHGNAHFLRGVARELLARGARVEVYEPVDAWSVRNLLSDCGPLALERFQTAFPELSSHRYDERRLNLSEVLAGADIVLVHEWNSPELVSRIGEHHARFGNYSLFFHDTHHRSLTAASEMSRYDLTHYDAVLAFGDIVRKTYLTNGWAKQAFTWHEAADLRSFWPRMAPATQRGDLVWIGNFGDEERTAELSEFLLEPVRRLGLRAKVYGVRYPTQAQQALAKAGIEYGGYLPNWEVPRVFAQYRVTVHVPRRPYSRLLPGIPTIRPFEALACEIPLVSAPWSDSEGLFTPGTDYLIANDGDEMTRALRELLQDADRRRRQADAGRATIEERHSCGHRVNQLLAFDRELRDSSARNQLVSRSEASRLAPEATRVLQEPT